MPRYVCRQRIERKDFAYFVAPWIVSVHKQLGCGALPEQGLPTVSVLKLASTDRARLDVMLAGGKELFSWPGGRSFGTQDPNDLLGGGLSGSGDFANFLVDVFDSDKVTFEFLGACPGADCARYRYDVPLDASRYLVRSPTNVVRRLGFHGTFDVDPQSANLLRMSVTATDPSKALSEACDIRTRMAYARTATEEREFMIPESTEREYLSKDGSYSVNRVVYEGCQEYTAESVLTFGADSGSALPNDRAKVPQVFPAAGSDLQLRLASRVDADLASAGDSLEAALVRPVRDANGGTIPAGTVFWGHLTQVEKAYIPERQLLVGIRFDTIVLNGVPVPLTLDPMGEADPHWNAVFRFPVAKKVVLDKKFVSRWRVGLPVQQR
jgi:hypothetical protein